MFVGKPWRWKPSVWSPLGQVWKLLKKGKSSQFAEVKAIHLALGIAEGGRWPILNLYTDLKEEMQYIDRLMVEGWTWRECETCCNCQGNQLKPMRHEGQWQKYKYGEVWKIDSITLPQACRVMGPVSASLDLGISTQHPFNHSTKVMTVKITQINEKWILIKPMLLTW